MLNTPFQIGSLKVPNRVLLSPLVGHELRSSLRVILAPLRDWTATKTTRAEVETHILDRLHLTLPTPPFSEDDKTIAAHEMYDYLFQRSQIGGLLEEGDVA